MSRRLTPAVETFLGAVAGAPALVGCTAADARAAHERAAAAVAWPRVELAHVVDLAVPVAGGHVPVRWYHPRPGATVPALVYCHGGGWVVGTLDTYDALCRQVAHRTGAAVASVGYRLAPEHRFPTQIEDSDAVLEWVVAHAPELGIDPSAVAVAGDSAGGYLAAHVARRAAARGRHLSAQVLFYPIIDPSLSLPSAGELADGYYLTTADMRWYWAQHLGGADPADATLVGVSTPDGLCPATIVTAGLDPLRDEGALYARQLAADGLEVDLHVFEDMIHGFVRFGSVFDRAGDALDIAAVALARRWAN